MKSVLVNAIIPTILVLVSAAQYYQVKTNNLTPWKGGGFGMYSTMHFEYREVWFFGLNEGIDPFYGNVDELGAVRRYPSINNIELLANKVKSKYNVSNFTVEVWEEKYSQTGVISRELLNIHDVY